MGGRTPRLSLSVQYAVPPGRLPAAPALRRWAKAAQEQPCVVTMRFVGRRESQALNSRYRGKDGPTNVLAFVYDGVTPLTGDIVLCAPVLRAEARTQRKPLADHCAHLVVHGMLHLQGYDHDTDGAARRMEALETAILDTLRVADPYGDRLPRARG